jgi:hypothetical protein
MFNTPNYSYPLWNTSSYPYQTYGTSQPQLQTPQSYGINWVQGEAGAKSYPVAPGQSVLLMDSESNIFYIKSSDNSGMPMPLRIFDFKERTATQKTEQTQPAPEYITRKEFEKRLAELKDGKQHIQSNKQ